MSVGDNCSSGRENCVEKGVVFVSHKKKTSAKQGKSREEGVWHTEDFLLAGDTK